MRTNFMLKHRALLLVCTLAAGTAVLQAQDTLDASADRADERTHRRGDQVSLNGDLVVGRNEVVEGNVVVMRGNLRIEGEVHGDVRVAAGSLHLAEGASIQGDAKVAGGNLTNHGSIHGDARVAGGKLINQGGEIFGEMRADGVEAINGRTLRNGRSPAAAQAVRVQRSWFAPIGEGIAGLISTLAFGLVLAGMGAALIFYGFPQLEMVSDAVRRGTLRAGGAGLAASFLVLPAFVVMVVALAVTIVGIPLLLVAVPLYPVAVAAAAAFGILAVAHAIGERTAEQRGSFQPLHRNSYTYLFSGIGILLAPLAASHLIQMTGFLSTLGSILEVFSWILVCAAAIIGVGAVLLTRAGTRRPGAFRPFGGAADPDAAFDHDLAGRGPGV